MHSGISVVNGIPLVSTNSGDSLSGIVLREYVSMIGVLSESLIVGDHRKSVTFVSVSAGVYGVDFRSLLQFQIFLGVFLFPVGRLLQSRSKL